MEIVTCYVCHDKYIVHTPSDGDDVITADGCNYLCCECTSFVRKIIWFKMTQEKALREEKNK